MGMCICSYRNIVNIYLNSVRNTREHSAITKREAQNLRRLPLAPGLLDRLPDTQRRGRHVDTIDAKMEEIACKTNPLGVKGIGESGTIGAPPTIINAVIDALRPLGVTQIDMPATPLRVWEAIGRARGKAA